MIVRLTLSVKRAADAAAYLQRRWAAAARMKDAICNTDSDEGMVWPG
jgi:hypothetical protein